MADRLRHLPLAVVLTLAAAGVALAAADRWRRGAYLVAGALILGGVFRLVLPARRAGLLVVRGRTADVAALGGLGVALAVVARLVPAATG